MRSLPHDSVIAFYSADVQRDILQEARPCSSEGAWLLSAELIAAALPKRVGCRHKNSTRYTNRMFRAGALLGHSFVRLGLSLVGASHALHDSRGLAVHHLLFGD